MDRLNEATYTPTPHSCARDVIFILHADHELNCSTAAVRQLGSTVIDPYVSIAGATAALYGPSHGGANEAALKWMIGSVENIPAQHLAELFGGLTLIPATTVLPASDSIHATQSADILSDLFTPNSARIPASIVTSDPLADLIKSSNITIDALPSTSTTLNKRLCFEKSGLKIYLIPQHATDKSFANVNAIFENDGFAAVTNLSFQVAVPKSLRLQINPPSSAFIPPKGTATQSMKIENPSKAVIKLRLKIGFLAGNEAVEDLVEVGGL
ncbi:hypothetical protein HK100_006779 [Physocladia obscura]|uniref:Citrate synthase n=1 Tax=Physocladia obscura TaxID=109957 RepID=A0AAD5T5L3_9FUNG|nr:hypothetical protein HK100_006779 [Physocladia obscura]